MILEILVERTQTTTLLLEIADRSLVTGEIVKQGVKDSIGDFEWDDPTITSFIVLGEANPEDVKVYKVATAVFSEGEL